MGKTATPKRWCCYGGLGRYLPGEEVDLSEFDPEDVKRWKEQGVLIPWDKHPYHQDEDDEEEEVTATPAPIPPAKAVEEPKANLPARGAPLKE